MTAKVASHYMLAGRIILQTVNQKTLTRALFSSLGYDILGFVQNREFKY